MPKYKKKMKVTSDEESFEIPEEDKTICSVIVAITCPICKSQANKIEPDLFQCWVCNRLWMRIE